MGVDLCLMPFEADFKGFAFSHSLLELERRRDLWEPIAEIEKAHGQAVPTPFYTFRATNAEGSTCYGNTIDTSYGDSLKCVTAAQLLPLAQHEAVTDNPINRAVWAYLACLSPETRIALFWH